MALRTKSPAGRVYKTHNPKTGVKYTAAQRKVFIDAAFLAWETMRKANKEKDAYGKAKSRR